MEKQMYADGDCRRIANFWKHVCKAITHTSDLDADTPNLYTGISQTKDKSSRLTLRLLRSCQTDKNVATFARLAAAPRDEIDNC
jgi:hypothetical protein